MVHKVMKTTTYSIISSDHCGSSYLGQFKGPAEPGFVELYREFLDVFQFPYPPEVDEDDENFRNPPDREPRYAWEHAVSLQFREILVDKFDIPNHEDEYFHAGISENFAAWLIRDKGFVLLPDDQVHLWDDGPDCANWQGRYDRGIPRMGSYRQQLRESAAARQLENE